MSKMYRQLNGLDKLHKAQNDDSDNVRATIEFLSKFFNCQSRASEESIQKADRQLPYDATTVRTAA